MMGIENELALKGQRVSMGLYKPARFMDDSLVEAMPA